MDGTSRPLWGACLITPETIDIRPRWGQNPVAAAEIFGPLLFVQVLQRCHTAVDHELGPDDKSRFGSGEKEDSGSNLLGCAEAFERNLGRQSFQSGL